MRLVLTFLAALAFAAPAQAATAQAESFDQAISAIEKRVEQAGNNGAIPTARGDRGVAAEFGTIRSTLAQYGTSAFPLEFPNSMQTVCGRMQKVLTAYVPTSRMIRHQDEVTILMVGTVSCMAQHLTPFEAFWSGLSDSQRNDGRQAGVTRMRSGVDLVLVNLVALSVEREMSPANQRALADAAADWAGALGSIFSLSGRADLLKRTESTTPAFARKFPEQSARLRAGLNDQTCNAVCQLP